MRIKLTDYNEEVKNKDIQGDVKHLVESIFTTKGKGGIGYIQSRSTNFHESRHNYFKGRGTKSQKYLKPQRDKSINKRKIKDIGPLEFSLLKYLLLVDYNVIILTGALGSGKSAISNYCLDFLEESIKSKREIGIKLPSEIFLSRFDFNSGVPTRKREEILELFYIDLFTNLEVSIERLNLKYNFINTFFNHIVNNRLNGTWEIHFNDFIQEYGITKGNHVKNFKILMKWIKSKENKLVKLRLLSFLVGYIKETFSDSNISEFIFFFDNLDQIPDDTQLDILSIIFSLVEKSNIKVLVPLRLTSFGKINGYGSYSFGIFQNTGHLPRNISLLRMVHYKENTTSNQYKKSTHSISNDNLLKLQDRISYILPYLKNRNTRLSKCFDSIAGNSVRRGLYLSERLFLNNVLDFKDDKINQDRYIHSILVGNNTGAKLDPNDSLLVNIFTCNETINNSLINIRILQILHNFWRNRTECSLGLILAETKQLGHWNPNEIFTSINYMLNFRKRLIYIEGVREYKDVQNLEQSISDKVYLTYTGYKYLTELIYNMQYIQDCFNNMDWSVRLIKGAGDYISQHLTVAKIKIEGGKLKRDIKASAITSIDYLINTFVKNPTISDYIPIEIDYNLQHERIKIIRQGLVLFFIADMYEIICYQDGITQNNIVDNEKYIQELISINIITSLSLEILRVLRIHEEAEKDEISNWYSLLIICEILNELILNIKHKRLNSAIKRYKNVLDTKKETPANKP